MYMPQPNPDEIRNINMMERWLSMIGGGALTTMGLRRRDFRGFLMTLAGGYLIQRGLSGHDTLYHALGINTMGYAGRPYSQHRSDDEVRYKFQADQAEGERSARQQSTRVGPTPGSAEGDRETVEADLQSKSPASGI